MCTPMRKSIAKWRNRLADNAGPLKVGLVWAGNKDQMNDHNRSMTFQPRRPRPRAGVRFHSLQKGEPAEQAHQPLRGCNSSTGPTSSTTSPTYRPGLPIWITIFSVGYGGHNLDGATGKKYRFDAVKKSFADDDWRYLLRTRGQPRYPTDASVPQPAPDDSPVTIAAAAWPTLLRRHTNSSIRYN